MLSHHLCVSMYTEVVFPSGVLHLKAREDKLNFKVSFLCLLPKDAYAHLFSRNRNLGNQYTCIFSAYYTMNGLRME